MKKLVPTLLSLALAGSLCLPVLAAPVAVEETASPSGYAIQVNGADTEIRGSVMVPLRALAEELGFTVTWSGEQIRVDTGKVHTDVTLGVDRYVITTSLEDMVGMSAPFSLGCPPYAVNGTTYVPLALFDALLGNQEDAITGDSGTISIQTDPSTQIPNPFVECGTLAEAQDQAGFSLNLPDGCTPEHISVLPDQMIQVLCEDNLTIRKAVGQEDISGDYTAYPQVDTLSSHETEVTLKGDADTVKVAVWTTEGYTYAIQSAAGLSRDAMLTLVASVA